VSMSKGEDELVKRSSSPDDQDKEDGLDIRRASFARGNIRGTQRFRRILLFWLRFHKHLLISTWPAKEKECIPWAPRAILMMSRMK